ncbi:polyprenyl synthetase family protein [uncultured Algibacter sp.]|uniref:polyprenyl synthetase family protein n=1 Tax=uncultured Algibacter sp. TaxID=298659 RepID=UPI003216EA27
MNLSNGLKIDSDRKINPFNAILEDLLKEDIERFLETLDKALEPQKKYLTNTELEIYQRGKKLRPIMLLLSARLIQGEGKLSPKVIKAAVSLEMLHVATLIHDDIIDDALMRRGLESVNATRGTNTAILIGDMQFVQAIRCFVDAIDTESEMGLVKIVLDTAFQICAGELDEIHTDPNWDIATLKERYFEVIERKTAIMFGLACETGLALAGGRTRESRRIGFYGRRIGRAFQIMDDLFDFLHEEKDSGKIKGIDLEQKRLSLPIIYAMEELGPNHLVSKIIRSNKISTPQELKAGIEAIQNTMAYTKCYNDARHEAITALDYLDLFPKNKYRKALEEIAFYTVDRSF